MEAELIDLLSAVRPAILHHLHSLDVQSCSDVVGVWGSCAHFCHGRTTKRLVGVLVCDCTSSHKGNAFGAKASDEAPSGCSPTRNVGSVIGSTSS